MTRFIIQRKGMTLGAYQGTNESEALDAMAREEQFKDFEDSNKQKGLIRDDYSVRKIEE